MKSQDQLKIGLYLMFSTVLASLTLFCFVFLFVYFGHKHLFFISNSILGVNVRVGRQIYVFKDKSCLGHKELLRNFQKFNFTKFVLNNGSFS